MYIKFDRIRLKQSKVYLILIILLNSNQICISKKMGGSSSKPNKIPPQPLEHSQEIYNLSFSSPFIYNYSPWVTRKLLLTLNDTSTNVHYYSYTKGQLQDVITDNLQYDYECNDPSVVRNKLFNISSNSIDSNEFKDSKIISQLNCNEKVYLREIAIGKDKDNWSKCKELDVKTIDEICSTASNIQTKRKKKSIDDKEAHDELKSILNEYSLKYCSKFLLKDVVSGINRKRILGLVKTNGTCNKILSELVQLDALVNFFSCEFDQILSRIYCQGYSVKETCDECSTAYKQWLCSMILPYHIEDLLIKPCLSICQRVERTCPYLHPEMKDQYGGEPIFICNDPDIPVAKNSTDEPYGKDRACYQKCHLEANHTLTIKSLQMRNILFNTSNEELSFIASEEALQENPELEICIPREIIIRKLNSAPSVNYEENEEKTTISNQGKRDLYAKWSSSDGFNARMVDQIELEEEQIVEEINKETILEDNKRQLDDIYYLDNNTAINDETNQTINSTIDEQFKYTNLNTNKEKDEKLDQHTHQQQTNFHHFSEDDENDNEDGLDDDLDQLISTTTITSFVVNKQSNHQTEKKQ